MKWIHFTLARMAISFWQGNWFSLISPYYQWNIYLLTDPDITITGLNIGLGLISEQSLWITIMR